MKAAIYTRVSTNDQVIRGESLDMQKERLVAYIKSQGWELYKIYEDGGYSGKDTNRPAFQELMKDVGRRLFDVLIVYKLDRLSRSILDFHKTMEFFGKNKVSFVSITQQFDTTTSMGRLMLAILVDFANFEREIDVDRSIDSYMQRLSNGVPSGRIPFGYKREEKKVMIVPDEAEVVKQVYSYALRGLSMSEVAKTMVLDKYLVRNILTNPFYAGYIARRANGKCRIPEEQWKWHKGKHKPIISLEVYQEVKNLRKKNIKRAKSKHHSLFSKLIYCPYCDHNLTFHTKKNKEAVSFSYKCDPIRIGGISCGQNLREEGLERRLYDKLDELFVLRLPEQDREKNAEKSIRLIDRKIQKLVKLAQDEDITLREVEKQIRALKEQRAKILSQTIVEVDYNVIAKKIKSIKKVYPFMSREEKSQLWHILIKRITSEHKRLIVEWNGRFKPYAILQDKLPIQVQVWCGRGDSNPHEL